MSTPTPRSGLRPGLLPVVLLVGSLFSSIPATAHEIIYYGRATAISGNVQVATLTGKILLADVGMSCNGSPREEVLLGASNPAPLSFLAEEVRSHTQGIDGVAATESGVQDMSLDLPGLTISAEQIQSFAQAECLSDETVEVSGGSTFSQLTINGNQIPINGNPNQTIEIPDVGKVVINEQIKYSREFRVVGLHIQLLDPSQPLNGDVQVAAARAKIKTCEM